jgi:predicted DNA-binding ribbon-helix-helix protein
MWEPAIDNTLRMRRPAMKSETVKRSVVIAGHKTSVSLENAFWTTLKEIAGMRRMTVSGLIARIDGGRTHGNLSSAIRVFVIGCIREQVDQQRETNKAAA